MHRIVPSGIVQIGTEKNPANGISSLPGAADKTIHVTLTARTILSEQYEPDMEALKRRLDALMPPSLST